MEKAGDATEVKCAPELGGQRGPGGSDLDSDPTLGPPWDSNSGRTQRVSRRLAWVYRAPGFHPSEPRLATGPQIKEYDRYLLSLHTTLDSHPAKDKVRNGFTRALGLPREPLISAALIKRLGPSGRFPHSPEAWNSRSQGRAHSWSPDTSSSVDRERSQGEGAGTTKEMRRRGPLAGMPPKVPTQAPSPQS